MKIPVILGPTCSGKTSLALEIAKELNWDTLSIDSRQVFKDLDIGTGKFKEESDVQKFEGYWEIGGVKIWGYDVYNLDYELNVLKYCEFCREVITRYVNNKKGLIITCGTGFYLDFLMGRVKYTDINLEKKQELDSKNLIELNEILAKLLPSEEIQKIDTKNKRRVITKILSLENKENYQTFLIKGVEFEIYYLNQSREILYKNADSFIDMIIKKGVVNEYNNLLEKFPLAKAWDGLIYSEIKNFDTDLSQRMKFSIHAYIRRQQTYFKKMDLKYVFDNSKSLMDKIYINFK